MFSLLCLPSSAQVEESSGTVLSPPSRLVSGVIAAALCSSSPVGVGVICSSWSLESAAPFIRLFLALQIAKSSNISYSSSLPCLRARYLMDCKKGFILLVFILFRCERHSDLNGSKPKFGRQLFHGASPMTYDHHPHERDGEKCHAALILPHPVTLNVWRQSMHHQGFRH